ncbi:arylsulfotransferase family protein [Ruegeria sp.]|uniref:arylsulfotransferase family protein n=1 Tax=Ruegeria sp. TaxID=1879320 RepID=UPI003B590E31
MWPDTPTHIPKPVLNRKQHHLHGIALLEDGDIVFNFTELATLRVDPCGQVVWRLDRRGHHSVDVSSDGSLWIPSLVTHYEPVESLPNHAPPFEEFWVMHVSASGEVIDEFSLNQALIDNGYSGLLYGSTLDEFRPIVSRDTLHLNDVEVFDIDMKEGVAQHGDILVSLRNINSIILMDPTDRRIKFISTGRVMRQHDADFVDGNTISVFNNNNLLPEWLDNASGQRGVQNQSSSVDTISLVSGDILHSIADAGGEAFFTDVMGMHQRLDNGNLLVAEARAGRVLERSPDGRTVWEYYNLIEDNLLGGVTYAERLDPKFDGHLFETARQNCSEKLGSVDNQRAATSIAQRCQLAA